MKYLSKALFTRRTVLFGFGLALGALGFSLAHEQEIPWVSGVVYKEITGVRAGFNKVCGLPVKFEDVSNRYRRIVRGDLKLSKTDDGFNEFSNFILADLTERRI